MSAPCAHFSCRVTLSGLNGRRGERLSAGLGDLEAHDLKTLLRALDGHVGKACGDHRIERSAVNAVDDREDVLGHAIGVAGKQVERNEDAAARLPLHLRFLSEIEPRGG
jgi:hypothetical protein